MPALGATLLAIAIASTAVLVALAPGGRPAGDQAAAKVERPLPPPPSGDAMSVSEALARRRSRRAFRDRALGPAEIGHLCWAAQGISEPAEGLRTTPSAGALYPLTIFVASADGLEVYEPRGHRLRRVAAVDPRAALEAAAGGQDSLGRAPAVLVIVAEVGRTAARYGPRAERYCWLEAGHAAQNVLLMATALGLGGVPIGALDDAAAAAALGLPARQRVLYLLPVGHPRAARS